MNNSQGFITSAYTRPSPPLSLWGWRVMLVFGTAIGAKERQMSGETNERRFHGEPDRLRSNERLALLEVDRVITLSVEGLGLGRILDVGTGTGVFAEAFLASGFAVVGIDANGVMLEVARRLVPEAEFNQARAEAIPYGNGEFDLSFLGLLLHETDDPVQALREARRVSRARVVVLEWAYVHDGHDPPLEHRLSVEKILDIAKRAELEHVEHRRLTHTDLYRMAVDPVKVRADGISLPNKGTIANPCF